MALEVTRENSRQYIVPSMSMSKAAAMMRTASTGCVWRFRELPFLLDFRAEGLPFEFLQRFGEDLLDSKGSMASVFFVFD